MMKPSGLLSLGAVALLTVACSGDTRNDTISTIDNDPATVGTSGAARTEVDRGDRGFLTDMLQGGAAEVRLGTLASERAGNAEVKRFAQMMVQDHTKAGEQLQQIATQHNFQPESTALDDEHQALIDKLSALRGVEFDKEYMKAMLDGHEDVLDRLQSRVDENDRIGVATGQAQKDVNVRPEAADSSVEASLNQWAASTLPVVRGHLDRAKAINDALENQNSTASNR